MWTSKYVDKKPDPFDLFNRVPPHVRKSDTSTEAAESLIPCIKGLTKEVFNFIKDKGGATCDEVEVGLGLRHQTASSRIWDLSRKDFIIDSEVRRKTRSNRNAAVWVVK